MTQPPVISLKGVGRTYPGATPVHALHPCDLQVRGGDYVSIVGPSGAGKSTLLHLLGLLDRPTSGRYLFEGVDVAGLRERERTALRGAKIGFVFQDFQLMNHRNSVENVMLARLYRGSRASEDKALAVRALEAVGLAHRLEALPSRLSGGERQRVAIARAIAADPAVLLCDEPTGNLDSATSEDIMQLFDDLNRGGVTIMLITHDSQIAIRGRRHLRIHNGELSELQAPSR